MSARSWIVAGLLAGLSNGALAAPIAIQTLAFEGDPVPGTPGEGFASFRDPEISRTGRVAFAASDTARHGAYAVDDAGALVPLLRSAAPTPDVPGTTLGFVFDPIPLASGRVGIRAEISSSPPGGGLGFFLWDESGGAHLAARTGTEVEGTAGARLFGPIGEASFTPSALITSGVLGFGDATELNDEAAVRVGSSGATLVLREGDPAPSIPGRTVLFPTASAPDDRSEGLIASSFGAVYRRPALGDFELVLDAFAAPPGFPGIRWDELTIGPFPSLDQMAFAGVVEGGGQGIWSSAAGGALELAVADGDAVGSGLVVQDVGHSRPVFDGSNRLAFEANTVDGADARSSILLHDPLSGLALIARSGSPIPGLLDATFKAALSDPQMNAAGDIVFWGALSDASTPLAQAIFVRRADGAFEVVVREGQQLEVAPGVFATISGLPLPPKCLGIPCDKRLLSDDGQLVFRAEFSDATSGVFLARLPEPSAGLLALAALGAVLAARVPREQEQARGDGERRRQ